MANLQSFQAKICYTVAGMLIFEGRVLLIKHKKLGFWLNPGGHIELNELHHKAAEREFFEETGVRVRAFDPFVLDGGPQTEFLPNPILTNLHWVSKENYWARVQAKEATDTKWERNCEQHLNLMYLVQPMTSVETTFNADETTGMQWFTREELKKLETSENIKQEINYGFDLMERLS